MTGQLRVLQVVNDADAGGAQTLIERLGEHAHPSWESHLLVLRGRGALSERMEKHFASTTYLEFERSSWRVDRLVRAVSQAIHRLEPDVVHAHLLQSDLSVALSPRWRRDMVRISSIHTVGYSFGDPWRTRAVSRGMGALARRFDAVVACTPQALGYMKVRGYPRSRSHMIRNGVPVPAEPGPDVRPPQLVTLARWHPVKDFPTLLAAFARVVEKVPEARLLCAGVGLDDANEELVALVREHGVESSVQLAGPLDGVDVVLRASAGLVISSAYGEALPMAGIEALAAGTPVVTTRVGDTPTLVMEDFQCVPPAEPDQLADALSRLLTLDPAEYADLVRRSHALARERFDIAVTVSAYDELYRAMRAKRA